MGFLSINDYLNKVTTLGQMGTISWQKMLGVFGAFTAGRWYNMGYHFGSPMLQRPGEKLANGQLMGNSTGWTLGAQWTFTAPNTLVHTAGSNNASCTPVGMEASVKYGVEYWLSAVGGAGGFTPTLGGTGLTNRTATGQFHEVITSTNTNDFILVPGSATATGTFSNLSVVRILRGVPLTSADMGAMYMGSNVSTATKHIIFAGIVSAAANFVPGTWKLVDMLMAYPVDMNASGDQTLDNTDHAINGAFASDATWAWGAAWHWHASAYADKDTDGVTTLSETTTIAPVAGKVYAVTYTVPAVTVAGGLTVGFGGGTATTRASLVAGTTYTDFVTATGAGDLIFTPTVTGSRFTLDTVSCTVALPRYSDGAGVQAMVVWHSGAWNAVSNATSTSAHNISINYTNSAGTTGKITPVPVAGLSGAVPVMSHLDNSGVAANNFGPFLPQANGDAGIRSIQTFNLSAASGANNYAEVILCKEILSLPNTTVNVATERDFVNQVRSLPQIYDGANLTWLFMPGAATAVSTAAYGWFDYVWG